MHQFGEKSELEIELNLKINRELDDTDNHNISKYIQNLVNEIHVNTVALDPKSKIEAEKNKTEILSLFNQPIYVQEIKNQYWGDAYWARHLPWFKITTPKGIITVGWRKRVINIDWSESDIKIEAKELFPDEDVTKFDQTIHAWSLEKGREYINKLLNY